MELVWTWPESWRIASAILIVLPLGILIGLFFPLGLRALDRRRPGSVPLAWAVNGIASVMASIISIMVSMTWGFRMVLVLALSLYVVAGVTAGFLTSDSGRR